MGGPNHVNHGQYIDGQYIMCYTFINSFSFQRHITNDLLKF